MSLYTVTTSTGATAPKVWVEGDVLWARTSMFWQVLLLFFYCKTVAVDPKARTITVATRWLWGITSERVIPFDEISHFEYRYGSLATNWDFFGNTQDRLERYSIAVALRDNDEVPLFAVSGEGSASTGVFGVLMGDSLIDVEGDQHKRSLGYLDALQELTGKGLSKFSKPNKYKRPY